MTATDEPAMNGLATIAAASVTATRSGNGAFVVDTVITCPSWIGYASIVTAGAVGRLPTAPAAPASGSREPLVPLRV